MINAANISMTISTSGFDKIQLSCQVESWWIKMAKLRFATDKNPSIFYPFFSTSLIYKIDTDLYSLRQTPINETVALYLG